MFLWKFYPTEPRSGSLQLSQMQESRHNTGPRPMPCWVAVKELTLSYHNPETILFTIYPYYGTLNSSSLTAAQCMVT